MCLEQCPTVTGLSLQMVNYDRCAVLFSVFQFLGAPDLPNPPPVPATAAPPPAASTATTTSMHAAVSTAGTGPGTGGDLAQTTGGTAPPPTQYVRLATYKVGSAQSASWSPPIGFFQGIAYVSDCAGKVLGFSQLQVRDLDTVIWPSSDFTLVS